MAIDFDGAYSRWGFFGSRWFSGSAGSLNPLNLLNQLNPQSATATGVAANATARPIMSRRATAPAARAMAHGPLVLVLLLFLVLVGPDAHQRLAIDLRLRDHRQLLIGGFLFVERLAEQVLRSLVSQQFREVRERTVGRDLVVLDLLRARDQCRIENGTLQLFYGVLPFLDDPQDAVAFLSTDGFADCSENLFESLYLSLGFAEMIRERRAELLGFRRLRHARKCLGQPFLAVVHIAEFFNEQFL